MNPHHYHQRHHHHHHHHMGLLIGQMLWWIVERDDNKMSWAVYQCSITLITSLSQERVVHVWLLFVLWVTLSVWSPLRGFDNYTTFSAHWGGMHTDTDISHSPCSSPLLSAPYFMLSLIQSWQSTWLLDCIVTVWLRLHCNSLTQIALQTLILVITDLTLKLHC